MESLLLISKIGFPIWSVRNCKQQLFPIKAPALRRTVHGTLISILPQSHQKYATVIECNDKNQPAFEQIWVGDQVTISSMQTLVQSFNSDTIQLGRPAVDGSITVFDQHNQPMPFACNNHEIKIADRKQGYVQYRPILQMLLKNFQLNHTEWDLQSFWQLELEEI